MAEPFYQALDVYPGNEQLDARYRTMACHSEHGLILRIHPICRRCSTMTEVSRPRMSDVSEGTYCLLYP